MLQSPSCVPYGNTVGRMRLHEIEAWALSVADRVVQQQPVEDDRVELKAALIDPGKAARRLAGHANAARGASLLWLFGVDDAAGAVPGVAASEFAAWWARTSSLFSEVAPEVQLVNVPYGAATIVALLVHTDRVPFTVSNPAHGKPNGGPVELEVPWREGTGTRSARRSDLLRLLVPAASAPEIEVLRASLTLSDKRSRSHDGSSHSEEDSLRLSATFYIEHRSAETLVIPEHRTYAEVVDTSGEIVLSATNLELGVAGIRPTFSPSGIGREVVARTVERGAAQLLVYAPGLACAWKDLIPVPSQALPEGDSLEIRIVLRTIPLETPIQLFAIVQPQGQRDAHTGVTWSTGAEGW